MLDLLNQLNPDHVLTGLQLYCIALLYYIIVIWD